MTAITLLEELTRRGAVVTVKDGNRLLVNAPKGAIDADLRRELVEHKAELLSLLSDQQPVCPRWQAWQRGEGGIPPLSTCLHCGYPDMPTSFDDVDGERWQRWTCPRCGQRWSVPLSDEPLPLCPRCGGGMDATKPTRPDYPATLPDLRLTCVCCEFVAQGYTRQVLTACWRCDGGLERQQVGDDWTLLRCPRCAWTVFERTADKAT
jgi:uncharacterized C2H2 Zn-finger protein